MRGLDSTGMMKPGMKFCGWFVGRSILLLSQIAPSYPTHPKTIELLRDRALNASDEQLREWVQEQLKM
ncbi:MAG: hypothetical protein HC833_22660 [Leptolyngbyaceae cyanobacterium RM1_406_9]|nr:hypothetical protein [Leptolyngbyaceae cyanobacterium RM1_406_9]